jgi:MFS family permease
VIFITMTGGPYLTGLALYLGANDFKIGLLAAIPFLAQLAQLIAAYRIDSSGRCKSITTVSLVLAREVWWLLLPIPLIPGEWRLNYLLGIFIISSIGATMGAAGWFTWVADLVPGRIRGRYFGFRSASVALSTILAMIFAGLVLDYFHKAGNEATGFGIVIGTAAVAGLAAWGMMKRLPERRIESSNIKVDRNYFFEPLRNPQFRKLIGIFFVWNVGTGIAAVFFSVHMLTNLMMTFTQVSFYSVLALLAAMLSNKAWGSLIDRYGSKPVIVSCAFGLSIVPLIWLFPRPGYLWLLAPEAIYAGVLWAGFNLAAFNIPMTISPQRNRTIYLAMFAVISGIGFFIASLVGGYLAESWAHVRWTWGKQTIVNYHVLFVISTLIRGVAAALAMKITEPLYAESPGIVQLITDRFVRRNGRSTSEN